METRWDLGMKIRRDVLGDGFVDKELADEGEMVNQLQKIITEFCWGTIWSRGGISLKVRSLLTLAMLTALNRPHQLKAHLRGAVNNGCTKDEIYEVFFQASAYCGMPAAVEGVRLAKAVFDELDAETRVK